MGHSCNRRPFFIRGREICVTGDLKLLPYSGACFASVVEMGLFSAFGTVEVGGSGVKIEGDIDGFVFEVQLDIGDEPGGFDTREGVIKLRAVHGVSIAHFRGVP